MRAKSDWMQVFENDKERVMTHQYPVTKYEQYLNSCNQSAQGGLQAVTTQNQHYYAGVEVPATYEKEYHASIIRVGQLEAEVAALRAEVTRLAEWRLMVAEQGAEEREAVWEKMVQGVGVESPRDIISLATKLSTNGASVADERPADSPVTADVNKTIDHLINGRVVNDDVKRLGRAVDQVNRGATGPIRGIGG